MSWPQRPCSTCHRTRDRAADRLFSGPKIARRWRAMTVRRAGAKRLTRASKKIRQAKKGHRQTQNVSSAGMPSRSFGDASQGHKSANPCATPVSAINRAKLTGSRRTWPEVRGTALAGLCGGGWHCPAMSPRPRSWPLRCKPFRAHGRAGVLQCKKMLFQGIRVGTWRLDGCNGRGF
jgi:hypothetical protein